MKKIALIVGTRPNLIKAGPLYREFKTHSDFQIEVTNTGQHWDRDLNEVMERDFYLNCNKIGIMAAWQDERAIPLVALGIIEYLQDFKPDAVMVLGDTDSALSGAFAAHSMDIPLIHYESGMRIHHERTVEDRNRRVIDRIASIHFCTDKESMLNLVHENQGGDIYTEGNLMIDALRMHEVWNCRKILGRHNLGDGEYFLMTLHRRENQRPELQEIFNEIDAIHEDTPVVWVQHPSMMGYLNSHSIRLPNCNWFHPLNYLDFHSLLAYSKGVITDSGGIPAECAYYEKPCVYLREETEWKSLKMHNVMRLVGLDAVMFEEAINTINKGLWGDVKMPDTWDGHTASRIVHKIAEIL